jgi:hypothetical protein
LYNSVFVNVDSSVFFFLVLVLFAVAL